MQSVRLERSKKPANYLTGASAATILWHWYSRRAPYPRNTVYSTPSPAIVPISNSTPILKRNTHTNVMADNASIGQFTVASSGKRMATPKPATVNCSANSADTRPSPNGFASVSASRLPNGRTNIRQKPNVGKTLANYTHPCIAIGNQNHRQRYNR